MLYLFGAATCRFLLHKCPVFECSVKKFGTSQIMEYARLRKNFGKLLTKYEFITAKSIGYGVFLVSSIPHCFLLAQYV